MDNREYFLLSKVENILVAKNYEFQTHNNMIRVYFDSGDEIEIVLSKIIIMNKYINGVTKKFTYESEDDFLKILKVYDLGFMCGNNNTSLIDDLSVNSMINLSMPMPAPAVGGMPYSIAFIKSSSYFIFSSSDTDS